MIEDADAPVGCFLLVRETIKHDVNYTQKVKGD